MWTMDKLTGRRFERWTVLDDYMTESDGERRWHCRCDCGTEKYVLERSLKYGGSKSCGCRRKENAEKARTYDLDGKVFGALTVLQKAENQRKNGGTWWRCRCDCGAECDVSATLLMTGKKKSCGCRTVKHYASADISGERFRKLVALYPTDKRTDNGSVIWQCRCDCGKEVEVSYNELMYTHIQSCGCMKRAHDQKLNKYLTHVEGTSIDAIKSKKVPTDNTTGYRGVYNIRGKYLAKIVFQKKQYYLGKYDSIEEAVKARREAEAALFDSFSDYYRHWNFYAEAIPGWAEEHPIRLVVSKKNNELSVAIYPKLKAIYDQERKSV